MRVDVDLAALQGRCLVLRNLRDQVLVAGDAFTGRRVVSYTGKDSKMRIRGKVDRNHGEIVLALRQAGATVQSLADVGHGCPDLLVGFRGRNRLMEVKDGLLCPSRQRLSEDEQEWQARWEGECHVVHSVEEALEMLLKEF